MPKAADQHRRRTPMRTAAPVVSLAILWSGLAGCKTVGPRTVRVDRFNYNQAAAQSGKEQLLLNLVRLRYGEPVYWIEVGSMLSQYTFEAGAGTSSWEYDVNRWASPELRAAFGVRDDPSPTDMWSANIRWSDRPTITYNPLEGEAFAKRVMTPISAATAISLSQSGWSIDRILECCVQQVNGIQNTPIHDVTAGNWVTTVKFQAVAKLLKKIQDAGHLHFVLEYDEDKQQLFLQTPGSTDELDEDKSELGELLALKPDAEGRIRLLDGGIQEKPSDLSLQTRSLLGTMYALAQDIPAPEEHFQSGQIKQLGYSDPGSKEPWLKIEFSRYPTLNAFAQIHYNGYWFYIAKDDWRSKRTFAMLTYIFSLQATEGTAKGPLVTVGTGN